MTLSRSKLPPAPVARPSANAFVLYPLVLVPLCPAALEQVKALYERAYEEARRVVEPAITERDLLGVWN